MIEHVKNPGQFIAIVRKLLKKDGQFLLSTQHDPKQWTVLDDYAQHQKRFTIPEIKELLTSFNTTHLYTIGFPLTRTMMFTYNLIIKFFHLTHHSNWRDNKSKKELYKLLVSYFLKFDDLFKELNKGTTIIAVVKLGENC